MTGQPVCPNCGQRRPATRRPSIECGGDRVLVQKFLYDFRRPKRWEVAVFHFPGRAQLRPMSSASWACRANRSGSKTATFIVDGKIVRKSLAEIRAMRILVHDSRFQPQDAERFPRWQFRVGRAIRIDRERLDLEEDGQFVHAPSTADGPAARRLARLQALGPVAGPVRAGPRFLRLQRRRLRRRQRGRRPGDRGSVVRQRSRRCRSRWRLRSGSDQFVVTIPVGRRGSIELLRNNQRKPLTNCRNPFER